MSAEVESMFSARLTPWHQLGTVVPSELTAREALTAAELDWQVTKEPLHTFTEDGAQTVETHVATVRDSDSSILGVVGSGYEVIQNQTMLEWAENLIDTGEAQFTTAGSLRDGKIVFAALELNVDMQLPGNDKIMPYLIVASSHDASLSFKAFTSPTRVVCMNTLRMAIAKTQTSWTIKHTATADYRLDAARRMLGLTIGYYDEFSAAAHAMVDQEIREVGYRNIQKKLLPVPKKATTRSKDRVLTERNKMDRFYTSGTVGEFKGTAWGVFNAVNEYETWGKAVKGQSRAERHALRAMNDDFPLTTKAHKLLAERV